MTACISLYLIEWGPQGWLRTHRDCPPVLWVREDWLLLYWSELESSHKLPKRSCNLHVFIILSGNSFWLQPSPEPQPPQTLCSQCYAGKSLFHLYPRNGICVLWTDKSWWKSCSEGASEKECLTCKSREEQPGILYVFIFCVLILSSLENLKTKGALFLTWT